MTLVLAHDASDQKPGQIEPVSAWLRDHGLNPYDIYRIEVHVIDVPLLRIFEFLRNEDGKLYCPLDHEHEWAHPDGCTAARRDPYDVLLKSNPPAAIAPEAIL